MFILLDDLPFELPFKGGTSFTLRPIRNDEKSKILRACFVDREGGGSAFTDFRLYMVKMLEAAIVGWKGLFGLKRAADGKIERVPLDFNAETLRLVINKLDEDDFQEILKAINSPGAAVAKQVEDLGKASGPGSGSDS